jgi:methylmalonyl-CoA mutase cobalamin-binding domain/chain
MRTRSAVQGRPRRALVVLAGGGRMSDGFAESLMASLVELGIETVYHGREQDPACIAAVALEQDVEAVELCLEGGGGIVLLRDLLRELIQLGRRDIRIVAHRVS